MSTTNSSIRKGIESSSHRPAACSSPDGSVSARLAISLLAWGAAAIFVPSVAPLPSSAPSSHAPSRPTPAQAYCLKTDENGVSLYEHLAEVLQSIDLKDPNAFRDAVDAAVGRVKLGGPNGPLPPKLQQLVSQFLRVDPTIRPPRCFNFARPSSPPTYWLMCTQARR